MSARPPFETVKPAFNFDPAEETDAVASPSDEREAFKAKTAEAFGKADYVPPDEKPVKARAVKQRSAPKKTTKGSDEKLSFRRPRGRPRGHRKHSLSVKTTEQHLAFLYAVADQGELVGVLEAALEALAREVIQTGDFQGASLNDGVLAKAKELIKTCR